ncbi:hypothetical protein [Pelosinus fermentans]|uniref:Uncharacterized protein n=1 Tax=Pelosinus fermentans JBW45 TaxID=1192197 RepID=I9DKJ2_9FIRM|nr:hypothetical protein [Pelosinus fermentans]AJQ29148.1 hypothetical protein JBW_03811 [Pelosinus fermentans JBW45]
MNATTDAVILHNGVKMMAGVGCISGRRWPPGGGAIRVLTYVKIELFFSIRFCV